MVFDAYGSIETQKAFISSAIALGFNAIITTDGNSTILCSVINQALNNDIIVASYDFDISCGPNHIIVSQNDTQLAELSLSQAVLDNGYNATVGYVNDLAFTPLSNRNIVYQQIKQSYHWVQDWFTGTVVSTNIVSVNTNLVDNELTSNLPNLVDFIFAPYDVFSQASLAAIYLQNLQHNHTKVYGVDISTEDIILMTATNSPWIATAGTNPSGIGAILVRVVSLRLSREQFVNTILIPGVLITQDFLVANHIQTIAELSNAIPDLQYKNFEVSCWIETTF